MKLIADDPILRCMERSGYPPWLLGPGTDTEPDEVSGGEDEDGQL